jgi:restriction system protein
MSIPLFSQVTLPLLKILGDNKEHSLREIIEKLSIEFELDEEEKQRLLPSGKQAIFDNRVGWARTYLKKAGLLIYTGRGYFSITERGLQVLRENPTIVDVKYLKQFPEFQKFQHFQREKTREGEQEEIEKTPEESLAEAYQNLNDELANDLFQQLKSISWKKFERIVTDLLVSMGYGGTQFDAAEVINKSGDEGIDAIIRQDRLGLDVIYVQAKDWDGNVGRPEIHRFAGALQGKHARKGIFFTRSGFTKEAKDFAGATDNKIVLIDGETLVQYMIEKNVGVDPYLKYEVKKIDMDYFTEE